MPPPQDDVAFRSQEYARQVNQDVEPARQRMQGAVQGFAESVHQTVRDRQRNALAQRELFQRQQEIDMKGSMVGGELALQQLRINQAKQDLEWARAIHDTKAVEAQRVLVQNQAKESSLRVQKLERDMASYGERPIDELTYDEKLQAEASGLKVGLGPGGGWKVIGELPANEKEAALAKYEAWLEKESERKARPMIAAAQVRGEYGLEGKQIDAAVRRAVAEIGYQGQIDKAQIEAAVREAVAKLVAEAGQKKVDTQVQGQKDIAGQKIESEEKRAADRTAIQAAEERRQVLKGLIDGVQFDTSPEATKKREGWEREMEGINRQLKQLGGGGQETEPQDDEDTDAVLLKGILQQLKLGGQK